MTHLSHPLPLSFHFSVCEYIENCDSDHLESTGKSGYNAKWHMLSEISNRLNINQPPDVIKEQSRATAERLMQGLNWRSLCTICQASCGILCLNLTAESHVMIHGDNIQTKLGSVEDCQARLMPNLKE